MTTPAPRKEAMVVLFDIGKAMGLHSVQILEDAKKSIELMIKMKVIVLILIVNNSGRLGPLQKMKLELYLLVRRNQTTH
jgi:hypothetical protein